MSKKKKTEDGLKGKLFLENADMHKCRFRIDGMDDELISSRVLDLARDLIPADYEQEKYVVSGTIVIQIEVKKK